jgi:hypothetical protein
LLCKAERSGTGASSDRLRMLGRSGAKIIDYGL